MTYRIALARPQVTAEDRRLVRQVLDSDWLSRGPMVHAFESAFATQLGCGHAIAVSSGSAALHLALLGLGLEPGGEVIVPPFTVPATANMVLAAGGRVRFCDVEPRSMGLDPDAAQAAIGPATGALLPVHAFGYPAPMDRLQHLARRHDLPLIEDACEALGGRHDGRPLGTLGRCGSFGFYPNKQITTGEGGMLVTNDETLAGRVRRLRNHGRTMDGAWLDQEAIGLNYRMAELPAALGLGQVRRLDDIVRSRARRADWYRQGLEGIESITVPQAEPDHAVCLFARVVLLREPDRRDAVIEGLARAGIQAGRYFAPLHLQPAWRAQGWQPGQFPVTESLARCTLVLPFHEGLTRAEVNEVCDTLARVLDGSVAGGP